MEAITLYYRQGSSDKVYQAGIEPKDGGFVVNFAFGRRGNTLNTGTKTQSPVPYDKAKAIYDKLILEKSAKGYTPGESGTPYQHTDKESQRTGVHCQLLNSAEERELQELLTDDAYWMQEKQDGRRLLIQKKGDTVTGINRLGLAVSLPEPLVQCCGNSEIDFTIDGEAIGDTLHAFDVLTIGSEDLRNAPYKDRHGRLVKLLEAFPHPGIHLVETFTALEQKRAEFDRLRVGNAEGVIFKNVAAPYTAGRPASGGSQLKHKFHETASFIVGSVNAKRSVSLLLNDGSKMVPAGNVTIPPNHGIPQAGQVVECRYLYAFKESGAVYQPVYLGVRDDIRADESATAQLKYKADAKQVV